LLLKEEKLNLDKTLTTFQNEKKELRELQLNKENVSNKQFDENSQQLLQKLTMKHKELDLLKLTKDSELEKLKDSKKKLKRICKARFSNLPMTLFN